MMEKKAHYYYVASSKQLSSFNQDIRNAAEITWKVLLQVQMLSLNSIEDQKKRSPPQFGTILGRN